MGAVGQGIAQGVGSIAGGILGSNAANDAAGMQSEAAARAMELQKQMYDQQRSDQEPWRQAGIGALGEMGSQDFKRDFTQNDFQYDPGYQFRMQEGQKALERSAAARGGLQSGGALKALAQYGQNFASNEYQNAYNRFNADRDRRFGRLSQLAGYGQNANSANASAAQNYSGMGTQSLMDQGNARAAGRIGSANAWIGAINGITKSGTDYNASQSQDKWMNMWAKNRGGGGGMGGGTPMAGESLSDLGMFA